MPDSLAMDARLIAGGKTEQGVLPIRFENVGVTAGAARILDRVSLELRAGPPTILMGPNGAGKTTLLKLAMGLISPTSGRITFDDRAKAAPRGRAMVFQKPVMLRRTAAANVAFALRAAGRPQDKDEIRRLLDRAQIGALANRPARHLSGGEQQRLALARALARQPQVLFLDEPTASLDPAATKLVENIIANISRAGIKIVMSTHDLGQGRRLSGDVVFLANGRVVEHAPAAAFFRMPATAQARSFLAGDLVV
jgi:tungstate transport system ATP-binding protein